MPLIKARTNRVRFVRHICRLQEPHRDTLLLYAKFIGDTPDYVVNQLIDATIAKDREFITWRATQAAAVTTPPRIGSQVGSEDGSGAGSQTGSQTESEAGSKAGSETGTGNRPIGQSR
jgi:hypothetical protein